MITSSTYTAGHPQKDGRRYVAELHIDSEGVEYRMEYLAAVDADHAAICAARAVLIADQLAEAEAQALADDGV